MSNTPVFRYTLIKKQHSSAVYGPCEVCHRAASDVYHQTEQRRYTRSDGSEGWTNAKCSDKFGHLECLKAIRSESATASVNIAA
jgi:hypothetical protein